MCLTCFVVAGRVFYVSSCGRLVVERMFFYSQLSAFGMVPPSLLFLFPLFFLRGLWIFLFVSACVCVPVLFYNCAGLLKNAEEWNVFVCYFVTLLSDGGRSFLPFIVYGGAVTSLLGFRIVCRRRLRIVSLSMFVQKCNIVLSAGVQTKLCLLDTSS